MLWNLRIFIYFTTDNELLALTVKESCYIQFMTTVPEKKTTTFTQLACTENTEFTLAEHVYTQGTVMAGNKE